MDESIEQWVERCEKETDKTDRLEQEIEDIFGWLDGDGNTCHDLNYGIAIKTKINNTEMTYTISNELYPYSDKMLLWENIFEFNSLNKDSKVEFFIGSGCDGDYACWYIKPNCYKDLLAMLQDVKKDILSWND